MEAVLELNSTNQEIVMLLAEESLLMDEQRHKCRLIKAQK